MKKKLSTKENQIDFFGIDPQITEKLKEEKEKQLRAKQKQLQVKQQEAERQVADSNVRDELSDEDTPAKMDEYPQNSDTEILEEFDAILSYTDIDVLSVNGEFFSELRDFLLGNPSWDDDGNEIVNKHIVDSFKQFYKLNKDSRPKIRELTESVINAVSLDNLLFFNKNVNVGGKDWYETYLSLYLDVYADEATFLQEFITSALYDSDRRYTVSKSPRKIKICWYIDQRCLGSSDTIWGRDDAIWALFDRGYVLEQLGDFHIQKSPKAIKENIFAVQPHAKEYLKQDMGKDYLAIEFWKLKVKNQNNISDAWEEDELGRVVVNRTEKSISLDWEYPDSFCPYDEEEIISNCSFALDSITNYMFSDYDKEIMIMIRNAEGG
jgi:hypothetical protein